MTFDGTHFHKADGTVLPVTASHKRGRWHYRSDSGRLLASGVTPAEFVAEFWSVTLTDTTPTTTKEAL